MGKAAPARELEYPVTTSRPARACFAAPAGISGEKRPGFSLPATGVQEEVGGAALVPPKQGGFTAGREPLVGVLSAVQQAFE